MENRIYFFFIPARSLCRRLCSCADGMAREMHHKFHGLIGACIKNKLRMRRVAGINWKISVILCTLNPNADVTIIRSNTVPRHFRSPIFVSHIIRNFRSACIVHRGIRINMGTLTLIITTFPTVRDVIDESTDLQKSSITNSPYRQIKNISNGHHPSERRKHGPITF